MHSHVLTINDHLKRDFIECIDATLNRPISVDGKLLWKIPSLSKDFPSIPFGLCFGDFPTRFPLSQLSWLQGISSLPWGAYCFTWLTFIHTCKYNSWNFCLLSKLHPKDWCSMLSCVETCLLEFDLFYWFLWLSFMGVRFKWVTVCLSWWSNWCKWVCLQTKQTCE